MRSFKTDFFFLPCLLFGEDCANEGGGDATHHGKGARRAQLDDFCIKLGDFPLCFVCLLLGSATWD